MRKNVAGFMKATGAVAGLVTAAVLFSAPAQAAAAAGNAANGKTVFADNCGICHTETKGGAHKVGPNLFGVIGRKSATATGYTYSAAMMKANVTWSADTLKTYLAAPAKMVPGTKMGFPGFSDPKEEADLIAYLQTVK
jgi:cytochrome c